MTFVHLHPFGSLRQKRFELTRNTGKPKSQAIHMARVGLVRCMAILLVLLR
jgi:hypothetical protein